MHRLAAMLLVVIGLAAGAWWFVTRQTPLAPQPEVTEVTKDGAGLVTGAIAGGDATNAVTATEAPARQAAASGVRADLATLLVTVVWQRDKSPAADVEVSLLRRDLESHLAPRARTDAEGRAQFGDLTPGTIRPFAERAMQHGRGERIELVAGQVHEAVVELPPGITISGRVVDDAAMPVAEADVVAADWGGGSTEVIGKTAADGTFVVRDVAPVGHYGARKRGHVPSSLRTITAETGAAVTFEVVLPRGGEGLTGVVFGPDGLPVPGARVRAGSTEQKNHTLPDGASAMGPQPEEVRTDAAGRFSFASVVPGTVPLAVWSFGLAPWSQDVEVVVARTNEVSVYLVAGATLFGIVRDAAGEAVAAADISIGAYEKLGRRYLETAADGTFRIEGLPIGAQKATVQHEEHGKAEQTFEFVAGETRRWDVTLEAGAVVKGRVLDSDGKPVSSVIIEARPDPWQEGDRWFGHASPDDDGRFTLRNCMPDRTIQVTFRRKMFTELTVRDVLPGAEERTFRLPEEHWVHIVGTARGPDGEVIPGAQLSPHLDSDNSGTPVETVNPDTGAFKLGPYPPGPYSLRLSADGFPDIVRKHTLGPDETWDLGEVRFQLGGTLELHLVAEDDVSVDELRAGIYRADGEWLTSMQVTAGTGVSAPLLAGDYQLVFSGEIAAQNAPFEIRVGTTTKIDVHVRRGTRVTVTCPPPAGEPPTYIRAVVTNATGVVWRGSLYRRKDLFTASMPLAPGTYTVVAEAGGLAAQSTFEVGAVEGTVSLALAPK